MSDTFKAYVIDKSGDGSGQAGGWAEMTADDLMEGDVTVRVAFTTMNYKDALAITGKSPIVRRFPMIPGIDFAGEVITSDSPDFAPGDKVILNGWGVGETHMGGYAEVARVPSKWLLKQPEGLTAEQCMAAGTAGYTAALCVVRLRELGVTPEKGPILVTGASGGVGSFAIRILAALGYEVAASTGKASEEAYLKGLGASRIVDRNELSEKGRPLQKELWAGAVDSVGSRTLANVCAQIKAGGVVAACGLAQGFDFPSTVMPFILRGVTLAGIDSVYQPRAAREAAWKLIADTVPAEVFGEISETVPFGEVEALADRFMSGGVRGRVLIPVA